MDWLSSLGDSAVSPANPLKNTTTVNSDGTVTTGGTTTISDYTMIKANSMETALSIAKACPFIDIGGPLEVSECQALGIEMRIEIRGETHMGIQYRPAKREDSKKIAELINIASGGVVNYLFQDLVPGMSPVQVIAHSLENDNYPHSYKSAMVASDGNAIVAMALSYPSSFHKITDEMANFFPADRLKHLQSFYSSRVENTWYLDALCVFESHRGHGIGKKLISLTKEKDAGLKI